MIPFEIPPGIDVEAAFRLCVHFSEFTAKLDDGSSVDVPQNYDEWTVDYQCYTLDMLEKDLATRIKWGSGQQLVVSEFVMSGVGERKLLNDTDLSLAFAERKNERKLLLIVAVVDIPTEIDWDSLQITPLTVDQIGAPMPVIDEDTIYEFLGLRAEDERVEQARAATAQKGKQTALEVADELVVDDHVPGEDSALYDRENPPMEEGTVYASMTEFRAAVKHHAIIKKFELGTEKSCTSVFRGHCTADGCPWAIVARLMHDKQQVRITLNKEDHFCASTGRVKTKMASYKWISEKAIPFLKKNPNMGSTELQKELHEKYDVTLGYSTVHLGHELASKKLFGSWEESFGYLFNFKAEIELRMPGSVVEIDVINQEDGVYFHRFFCCLKPSIDGFLNGCRPFLSIDSTALNGRWNGHLPSATALDGCNWMFPVAFGFFSGETTDNWIWFMQQLHKAIGNLPHLAIISDACKGLENAIKTVYPWAEHRECFVHLMKNFSKRFQGAAYGRMYPAARTFQPDYHEYLMNKMYATNKSVEPWLKTNHKLKWMRSKFSEHIKCDAITSNVAEVWNNWVKDIKDLPPASLADSLRSKFMELYARRRRIGEKFEGHIMLPVVVRQLYALSRELGHLKVKAGGREEAEVTEVTDSQKIIRHVVNIRNHICTCREWQVSGKPCPHAMALITTCRNPKMEEYLHPYFSVYHFRLAYGGVIRPLPDMSQWARVNLGFKVLPPLEKRDAGRQRKLRIPSCIENKGNKPRGKGMWQVTCKKCGALGHRSSSPKCPRNGTAKKRKSRANKGKAGRPPGSSKRQKVDEQGSPVTASQFPSAIGELEGTSQINTSPGPVTRRQSLLAMVEVQESNQITASFGHVTTSETWEEAQNTVSTPTKSPARRRIGLKKKLTPRKGRNSAA